MRKLGTLCKNTLFEKNNTSEANAKTPNKLRRNTPLEGSEANEWTLFNIPDLTTKDARIVRRNVLIPRNTIHESKILFLLKISE